MQPAKTSTADKISEVKKELRKYLRYWYFFVVSIVVAITLVQLKLRYTPKEFSTVSKIKILDKGKGLELPSAAFIFNRSNINLDNEIELIKSFDVLEKVVDSIDLTYRWYEQGNFLTTEITHLPFKVEKLVPNSDIKWGRYKFTILKNSIEITNMEDEPVLSLPEFSSRGLKHSLPFDIHVFDKETLAPFLDKVFILRLIPVESATNSLKNELKVEITGKSSDVLKLTLNGSNAEKSEEILSALHFIFNQDGINDRQMVLKKTLKFIDERFEILVNQLDTIEINKENFKVDNKFISPEADLERGMTSAISSEDEIFRVESQIILVEFLQEQLERNAKELSLLPSSFNTESADINVLITSYNELIFQRDKFLMSSGENNPSVQQLTNNIEELKNNMTQTLNGSIQQLKIYESRLKSRNETIKQRFSSLPEKERLFRDIERQQKIKETLYLFLFQKREEAAINMAIVEDSIKIIEEPLSNRISSGVNTNNAIFFALIIGLLIPFVILYVVFLLDTKLHGKEDILSMNPEIPVVGEIPEMKKAAQSLFTNPSDRSVLAESFRILSSNVDFLLPINESGKGQVVFCTSTIKGEGKTYVSMNLSLALSSINKKVLIIGADLRNPQLHTLIDVDKQKPGLSNYLHDLDFDWREGLIRGFEKHEEHHILLSGSIPPNPANLLTNGRFKKLIEEAKDHYDYVVVDTAPTILVTDTMLISRLADATLYIVRAKVTDKALLSYSKDLFESGKLNNMAYVINSVGASRSYGYSYNYGYNYGYGSQA